MTRKIPVTWTHQEVSVLTKLHGLHGDSPDGLHKTAKSFERHTPADVRDKMIELGLIEKPQKPELTVAEITNLDERVTDMLEGYSEPTRTLAVRYVIKSLQDMLPKRTPKAVA